jgi:hypothetical protein
MIKENTEVELEDHTKMNRWEKVEFLKETTTVETHTTRLLEELLCWMGEDDFNKFYDHYCSCWDICRSYEELEEKYGDE